jgi:hypothetical protein
LGIQWDITNEQYDKWVKMGMVESGICPQIIPNCRISADNDDKLMGLGATYFQTNPSDIRGFT